MSDSPPYDEAAFQRLYAERFPEFQLAWSVFQLRYLSRLRRNLGELDDATILVALTVSPAIANLRDAALAAHEPVGPWEHVVPPPPTNAVRLAEMTGIPRETVRRRLLAMAEKGWLEQSGPPRREWRLAVGPDGWPRAKADLEAVHAGFVADMSRLIGQWDRVAREAGWEALTRPPKHSQPATSQPAAPRANSAATK